MLNSLDHYVHKSLDHVKGPFTHHMDLEYKVSYLGNFLPYWGNTVVFDLDEKTIEHLKSVQNDLYSAAGHMLATRLEPDTLHMTLRGLTEGTGPFPSSHERMERMRSGAASLIRQWRGQKPLQMRGTWIFNMNHTSLVLGLVPNNHDTYVRLMQMHGELDKLVGVKTDFCPHITLAYYKPGKYVKIDALRKVLRADPIIVELPMENLKLKNFRNMNHYETVDVKKAEWDPRTYVNYDGDLRTVIKCLEGEAFILRGQFISGSLLIDSLEADGSTWRSQDMLVDPWKETGNMWLQGNDDYLGTYDSFEEADRARDEYIENY